MVIVPSWFGMRTTRPVKDEVEAILWKELLRFSIVFNFESGLGSERGVEEEDPLLAPAAGFQVQPQSAVPV